MKDARDQLWKYKGQIEAMRKGGETECKIKLKDLEQIIDLALKGATQ